MSGEPSRARYPDQEGWAENAGVRIFFELYDRPAPTVLLLPPPTFAHARWWKFQVPYLARHFRVLTFDGRGNGRSDRPSGREAYGPEQFAGDALAVMDATHTDRAMLVAASPRAVVALRLAVDRPQRVSAAVFITPDLWPTEFLLRQFRLAPREAYADDEIFNPRYWHEDWPGFVERMAAVNLFPHPHSTRLHEDFRSWALETDGETFEASVRGVGVPGRERALELAGRIRCPVLVLENGGRTFGPREQCAPFAAAAGARHVVFEGLGPVVGGRWPVAMNIVLREFFDSVTP